MKPDRIIVIGAVQVDGPLYRSETKDCDVARSLPPHNDTLVRVIHGSNEQWLPVAGETIGQVKHSLREVFSIPYFADPLVNGHAASISDMLSAGDCLEFALPFGFKGGEGEEYPLAEEMIAADAELQNIRKRVTFERVSNDETVLLVTDYFIKKYGNDPDDRDKPMFLKVARQLMVAAVELTALHSSGQSIASAKRVHYDSLTHIFIVNGKGKQDMTQPQIDVLQTLYEAGEKGLSLKHLLNHSGHADARAVLTRLIKQDPDWASVIHLAGKAHGRYRLG
jgi:hypothetical protein